MSLSHMTLPDAAKAASARCNVCELDGGSADIWDLPTRAKAAKSGLDIARSAHGGYGIGIDGALPSFRPRQAR
jgi:hypothetical protein